MGCKDIHPPVIYVKKKSLVILWRGEQNILPENLDAPRKK
jgi:hypothetical protein